MYFQNIPYEPDSPKVEYKEGVLTFSGKTVSLNSDVFWSAISNDLRAYGLTGSPLTVIFKFEYYNSISARYLSTIFIILNDMYILNKNVNVVWCYYDIDENMKELGESYQCIVKFKIKFKEVKYVGK